MFLDVSTLAILNKSIVKRLFPKLHKHSVADKSNLITIKELEQDFEY